MPRFVSPAVGNDLRNLRAALETFAASMDSGKGPRQSHSGARRICGVRQLSTYSFDRARSYALYDAGLIRAIVMLKFERIQPLGDWFAERLAEVIRREGCLTRVDVVVPVPLHQQRKRERGYNQADLVAKPLARRLKLPYKPGLLLRKIAETGQAHPHLQGALGIRTWRFCHTIWHPS